MKWSRQASSGNSRSVVGVQLLWQTWVNNLHGSLGTASRGIRGQSFSVASSLHAVVDTYAQCRVQSLGIGSVQMTVGKIAESIRLL
jgi:hypothetical protein